MIMKQHKIFQIFLLIVGCTFLSPMLLCAQTLQVEPSPKHSKVNRSTDSGFATIFFDSDIEDLSIECTDQNSNEPIVKLNDHQWFMNVDVLKEKEDVCYRVFNLKCSMSSVCEFRTPEIQPNQVLYYTVVLINELEPEYLKTRSREIAEKAIKLVNEGDSYTAQRLLVYAAFPDSLDNPNIPYTAEAERALRYATNNSNATLRGHSNYVNSALFSPDGKYIVSASLDKTIKIWDVKSGICLKTLEGHTEEIEYATFSPDGKEIVSASRDKTIKLWDVRSGKCIKTFEGHIQGVKKALFSPDGRYILSSSYDDTVKMWNIVTGECVKTFFGEIASYSPDGKQIVTVWDNTVKIWDIETGRCEKNFTEFVDATSVCFSPDGKRLVTASEDFTVSIWDVNTGNHVDMMEHYSIVSSAFFSPDGKLIVSASSDGTIKIWDAETKLCVNTLDVQGAIVSFASP